MALSVSRRSRESRVFSTGFQNLDAQLTHRGLPPGVLVAVSGPPNSTIEHFLYNLLNGHSTIYFTTGRTAEIVESTVRELFEDIELTFVDVAEEDDPALSIEEFLGENSIDDDQVVVIDSVDVLETIEQIRYREFFRTLAGAIRDAGSLGLIHVPTIGESVTEELNPETRQITLSLTDVHFTIDHVETKEIVEDRLFVPKLYGKHGIDRRDFGLRTDDDGLRMFVDAKGKVR